MRIVGPYLTRLVSNHEFRLAFWLWLFVVGQAQATDWPRLRGVDFQGTSPDPILAAWPANGPPVAWRIDTSSNFTASVGFGSLAVSEGKVFVLKYTGTSEVCLALAPATGSPIWARDLGPGSANSTPTVSDQRVYVYSGNQRLFCLDSANGQVLWQHDLIGEFGGTVGTYGNSQSPWVEDGRVFVAVRTATHCLKAFDAANGTLLWEDQTNSLAYGSPVGATIHGIRQIIFPDSDGLVAVAPETGRLLWRHYHGFSVFTGPSPVVVGDIVLAYGATEAIRIDYAHGDFTPTVLWTNTWSGDYYTTLVVNEDSVYILSGGVLACRQLRDGQLNWKTSIFNGYFGSVIYVRDYLAVLRDDGGLFLAKASPLKYQELGRCTIRETNPLLSTYFLNSPAYSDGRLYVRNPWRILCYDTSPSLALQVEASLMTGGDRLLLTVSGTDGSAISTNRASKIGVVWSADLAEPIAQWQAVTCALVHRNGILSGEEALATNRPARFYSAVEPTQ